MKRITALTLACTLIMGLTACGKQDTTNEPIGNTDIEVDTYEDSASKTDVSENDTQEEGAPQENDVHDTVLNLDGSNIDKSISVADAIYNKNKDNIMFSPLSLNLALGLLAEGADEGTPSDKALESYLGEGFNNFASAYIHDKIGEFNMENTNEYNKYSTVFEIANSVWFSDALTIDDTYKDNVVTKYEAEIDTVNVRRPEESANKINSWCSDKTHDMIPTIVSADQIAELTSAILVNSVYFEAPWVKEWYDAQEEDCYFDNLDGTRSNTQIIKSSNGVYYENSKARAFGISYRNSMEFIGILPNEEGEFNLSDLDIPELLDSRVDDYNLIVHAAMTELNFETTASLSDILYNSELNPVFLESNDFIHMNKELEPTKVDDIIQKTKIELDKYGTRASAVTAIMMEVTSALIEEEPRIEEVYMNRPFAFVIYDRQNSEIVFIGKVVSMEQ